MKKLLGLLSIFIVISTNANASCPDLSGKFFDQFGLYNIVIQEGCETLTWTIDNNPATPGYEPGLPKTTKFILDSNDYTEWNGNMEVTNYAYFTNQALVISWEKRFWMDGVLISNYAREILTINNEKTILTQLEKDLKDENEFRSKNVDLSFHRKYLYTRQK